MADVQLLLRFVHKHACPLEGREVERLIPIRLDGSVDAPRVACAAGPGGEFFLSALEFVSVDLVQL